ncbi:hypothetical protein PUN28_001996 [Cardiocondyla obscurior]|uniref:Uncharacterized protein n=1 Tax=Cardiocondyla obscurior TaxID=286306 RepID=A0AAW2GS95_9HYME
MFFFSHVVKYTVILSRGVVIQREIACSQSVKFERQVLSTIEGSFYLYYIKEEGDSFALPYRLMSLPPRCLRRNSSNIHHLSHDCRAISHRVRILFTSRDVYLALSAPLTSLCWRSHTSMVVSDAARRSAWKFSAQCSLLAALKRLAKLAG